MIAPRVIAFLAGAVVLTLCDRVHVVFGVLIPTDRSLFGQSWWAPLVFGIAAVATPETFSWLRARTKEAPRERNPVRLSSAALVLVVAYACTGPLAGQPLLLTAGLTAAWALRAATRRSKAELLTALVMAVVGPLVEASIAGAGLFHYVHPDLLGVPIWLPAVYLHSGPLAGEIEPYLTPARQVAAAT